MSEKWIRIKVPEEMNATNLIVREQSKSQDDAIEVKAWEPKYEAVLDYGFVGMVDFMGDDTSIVEAARVSYAKGTKKVRGDRGLIRYLMRHNHTTPFEMVEFKFHIKAPIFVFRQWHRHRTFSINEMSARYSILDNEMYFPDHNHTAPQAMDNKQGRAGVLDEENYRAVIAACQQVYDDAYDAYQYLAGPQPMLDEEGKTIKDADGNIVYSEQHRGPDAIVNRKLFLEDAALAAIRKAQTEYVDSNNNVEWTEELIEAKIREWYAANEFSYINDEFPGIARELARMVLPVATYSQMYWKGNLKNLLHFISLRSDPHAQYEIRVYSDIILDMVREHCPMAVEAFEDYSMNGARLSRMEVEVLREYLEVDTYEDMCYMLKENGATDREVEEFRKKFLVKDR